MSTIASPRPSIALSSRRNSASTDTTSASTSNRPPPTDASSRTTRRNRTALRDYYGLKVPASPASAAARDASASPSIDAEPDSELDRPGFEPAAFVRQLLAHEGLEGVLRVEAGLVTDIRSLDGEKKALVYDNYSKLIAATDTIRRMRERMDPLTPTTSTLTPAIGHIAETAAELAASLRSHSGSVGAGREAALRRRQQETVRWVLAAPERIRRLAEKGETEAAKAQWKDVAVLLEKWKGVAGTEDVRRQCEEALKGVDMG